MVNSNYLLPPQEERERVINLRFLTKKEIEGRHKLSIFKKIGRCSADTTAYTCINTKYNKCYIIDDPISYTYSLGNNIYFFNSVDNCGNILSPSDIDSSSLGIRPVFSIRDIEDLELPIDKQVTDYNYYLLYGYYPQEFCSNSIDDVLNSLYKIKDSTKLIKTGNSYNGDEEYIYNKERYVRALVKEDFLCPKGNYNKGDYVWIKVEPIKWIYDRKKKLLVSEKILYGGIPFDKIKDYLKILAKEIQQEVDNKRVVDKPKEEVKLLESKTGEVDKILEDINYYLSYYHGKEDVNKIVNDIVSDYNNKLELINTSIRNKIINLEVSNREVLYNNLIIKLDIILDKLKKNYEDNQKYLDMVNIINSLRHLLEGTSTTEMDSDLYKDFKLISEVILPFIDDKEREEIKKELINILDSNSADILGFLDSIHIFSECSIKSLKYNTIDEFELNLRKEIHNTLIKLSHYVNRKDLISEIVTGINDNINGIYSESKNKVVSIYLNSIYSIIESINNKVNIDRNYYSYYLEEMNKILNLDIDYNLSNEEIFGLLINTYSRLSKLEIELDSEININEYKVRVKNI